MRWTHLVGRISALGATLSLAGGVTAQKQFDPLWGMPVEFASARGLAMVDVDGDGDLDLAVAVTNLFRDRLYLNDGRGFFTDATENLPADSASSSGIVAGDVDGDGDPDLVLTSPNRLYLNDGHGSFTDASGRLPLDPGYAIAVALGDVDGDGDLDIVLGNRGRPDALFVNDGSGYFTDATSAQMPADTDATYAIALGDLDADGDLDILLGNASQNRCYVNDGSGTFTDLTAQRMPLDSESTRDLALGDVDGDGDPDVVLGYGTQNRLYTNDGGGVFVDVTTTSMPLLQDLTNSVALGDVDGDGDLDLAVGNGNAFDFEPNRLYLNSGTGRFTDASQGRIPADLDASIVVAMGDTDRDGDLDLVFANAGQDRLYVNDGTGVFADATASGLPVDYDISCAVAHGDVDGDGDVDLVVGNVSDLMITSVSQNKLYLNLGNGRFVDGGSRLPVDNDETCAVALGDVNGDGALDILLGNLGTQNRLYLNDGNGAFADGTAGRLPPDSDRTGAVALGDLDDDGDLDLMFANGGTQNRLCLNDGSGTFTDVTVARLPPDSDPTGDLAFVDVDSDGDLDILGANYATQNRLYLNDGAGFFADATATRLPLDSDATVALAVGDLDGDGSPDLVLGNRWSPTGTGRIRMYLNDRSGRFRRATEGRMPDHEESTRDVALGDVDEDGDLDLVVGNMSWLYWGIGDPSRLYVNDGHATFTDETAARMPIGEDPVSSIALFDADGDRDLDLVLANASGSSFYLSGIPNLLYRNLHRQTHTPRAPAPGRDFAIQVHVAPFYGSSLHVALLGLSFSLAPRAISTPFGGLLLDPTGILSLPFVSVPAPRGKGVVCVAVPPDPTLTGSAVFVQGLVVDLMDPSRAALTNYTADVVAR